MEVPQKREWDAWEERRYLTSIGGLQEKKPDLKE